MGILTGEDDSTGALSFRPGDVLAIFRFHADDEVDVDLLELQGQERLDVFCGFLRGISQRLGKPVLMDQRAIPAIQCSASILRSSDRSPRRPAGQVTAADGRGS